VTPRAARIAVFAIFFINGFVSATWFVRIPAMQDGLDLSTAALGVTLLGLPAGAIVAMPVAGSIVPRFGSRHLTVAGGIACCLSLCLLGFATSAPVLFLLLVIFGAANAVLDVSMNAQGVAVEKQYGRSIMLSLHGGFSVGGMVGALIGGLIASQGISPDAHLLGIGLLGAAVVVVLQRWLLPAHVDAVIGDEPHLVIHVPRAVVILGLIALCGMLAEGSMSDWTAVYLRNTVGTGPGQASLGYAIFSLTMTIGRLGGDRVTDMLGGARVVRIGGCVAAVGLLLTMSVVSPWSA
jgi:predicted MFS family arabinose efflux permease